MVLLSLEVPNCRRKGETLSQVDVFVGGDAECKVGVLGVADVGVYKVGW